MTLVKKTSMWLIAATVAASGFVTFQMAAPAESHPGGLDAAGGHHCWTSCASHGMKYGEYRCHKDTKRCRKSNRRHHRHGHK